MKKGIVFILCLLLTLTTFLSALAAGSAYMGLSASSSTVYRDDTFTIQVNLSNDQVVGRGAIVLNYDSSVFEFVGGSCNVSGATLAEVSAGRKGGVFALAENKVVSGTIFTIQMKVKSGAAFGSYTISGSASMDIPCSAGSTTVTVTCNHNYSPFQTVDASNHQHSCTVCQSTELLPHSWNAGTVTQAATCIATGIRVYTCTGCGVTRDEIIPVNSNHQYAKSVKADENSHKSTCSLCGKTALFAHTWKEVAVTKAATCTETGSRNVVCSFCGQEATQEIPVVEHQYGAFEKLDEQSHIHRCTVCSKEETLPHDDSGEYDYDINGHYQICDSCGHTGNPAPHTPGPEATNTTPQTCSVCSRVLKPAGNHIHNFAPSWSAGQDAHWYSCDGCDEQSGLALHVYTNDCDDTCDVCAYLRTPVHSFETELTCDEQGHWYACTGCDEKKEYADHTSGAEASIQAAQVCTVCDFEMAPRLSHIHQYDGQLHTHQCVCGEQTDASAEDQCPICQQNAVEPAAPFPWWILCIVEGLAIIVLMVLTILRKKKA